jgi:peptidyl-prolyl cis-trans isomerase SurA
MQPATVRLTLLATLLLAPLVARAAPVNRIIATVDGDPITAYELKVFALRDVRGRQLGNQDAGALLEALITERVIEKEFSAQNLIIKDEDIDRYIESIRTRNNLTDEQLKHALAEQGIQWEAYRLQIRRELQKAQLIQRELGKVNIPPEEVERYYQAHLNEFTRPEEFKISQILLRVPDDAPAEQVAAAETQAATIYAELQKGADFTELARTYSQDSAAQSGGQLGSFKRGELRDDLEDQIMALQVGQVSRPFRTPLGIHIIRVDERAADTHQPLEHLADEIKQRLYNEALEERYNKWLQEDLRKRHDVEIFTP